MKPLKKVVELQIKHVYGKMLIYPINEDAHRFSTLMRRKTFDRADIQIIFDLGFDIEWVTPSVNWEKNQV